jgi:hypothetical protein
MNIAGLAVFAVACGSANPPPDAGDAPDASEGRATSVVVRAPNGGEMFRGGDAIEIAWKALGDGGLAYSVAALRGEEVLPIAQGMMRAGASAMTWVLPDVAAPTPLRIRVTVHDGTREVADVSDADFTLAPATQVVGFASELQPILSQRCAGAQCHGGAMPADGVDLRPGAARTSLVGVRSMQCDAFDLVAPGAPAQSYLMFKLAGTGDCFGGERMPRGATPLSATELALFESWIAAGARDN